MTVIMFERILTSCMLCTLNRQSIDDAMLDRLEEVPELQLKALKLLITQPRKDAAKEAARKAQQAAQKAKADREVQKLGARGRQLLAQVWSKPSISQLLVSPHHSFSDP